jgi:hypothetical protein
MLIPAVELAVSLKIQELQESGGPNTQQFEEAKSFSSILAEKGDVLLFGGGKKGEVAELFNRLVFALAVMAFIPGGVRFCGLTFKVD